MCHRLMPDLYTNLPRPKALVYRVIYAGAAGIEATSHRAVPGFRTDLGAGVRYQKKSAPTGGLDLSGRGYWRRPTFAQPIEALSSGLQRFTSVFGMGTGGSTALRSPEGRLLFRRTAYCKEGMCRNARTKLNRGLWVPYGLPVAGAL